MAPPTKRPDGYDYGPATPGWRAGCHAQPMVMEGAEKAQFDFAAADALGTALAFAKQAIGGNLEARAGRVPALSAWTGRFRDDFDGTKSSDETALAGVVEQIDGGLRSLRTAWDAACEGQSAFNRKSLEPEDPAPTPPPGVNVPR